MADRMYADSIADAPDPEVDPGPDETPEVAEEARSLLTQAEVAASREEEDPWDLRGEF